MYINYKKLDPSYWFRAFIIKYTENKVDIYIIKFCIVNHDRNNTIILYI